MATPAAIGVYVENGPVPANVRDRAWRGVYHHTDGTPEGLGNHLVDLVAREKGFMARVIRRVIDTAPRGWLSLEKGEAFHEEAISVAPEDTSSVCFVFVFDAAARRLDAFSTNGDDIGQRVGSVQFSSEGQPTSDGFDLSALRAERERAETVAWLATPVESRWESSTTAAVAARADVAERVLKECAAAGMPVERFVELVSAGVAEVMGRGPWKSEGPLTKVQLTGGAPFRRVMLGELAVHYPVGGRTRWTIEGDEFATFVRNEHEQAELNVRKRAVADVVAATDRKVVYDLLVAAMPTANWLLAFFDFVRATQVPGVLDAPPPPTRPQPVRAVWQVYRHVDGRVWAIRAAQNSYLLRLGDPADEPVIKERPSNDVARDIRALVASQLADGFARAEDELVS